MNTETITVTTKEDRRALLDRFYSFIDGRTVKTEEGVSGKITVRYEKRSYGVEVRVYHEADAKGRKTEYYQRARERMGDDWVTDLSQSEWLYVDSPLAKAFNKAEKEAGRC